MILFLSHIADNIDLIYISQPSRAVSSDREHTLKMRHIGHIEPPLSLDFQSGATFEFGRDLSALQFFVHGTNYDLKLHKCALYLQALCLGRHNASIH